MKTVTFMKGKEREENMYLQPILRRDVLESARKIMQDIQAIDVLVKNMLVAWNRAPHGGIKSTEGIQ